MSETGEGEFFKVLFGFIKIFAVLVVFGIIFYAFSGFLGFQSCDNASDWKQLKNTLVETENTNYKTSPQLSFNNQDCYLASFSKYQASSESIIPDKRYPITENPILCLCEKQDNNQCKAYDCFTFKSYDTIEANNSGKQFQTFKDKGLVFIQFRRNGNTLKILTLNEQKNIEDTLTYKFNKDYAKVIDKTNLINQLEITTTEQTVFNFLPYVELISSTSLKYLEALKAIPKSDTGNFPIVFDIQLADVKEEIDPRNLKETPSTLLDTSKIRKSRFILNLNITDYETLTEKEKANLALYYKKDNTWLSKALVCSPISTSSISCIATIPTFVNSYAISVEFKDNLDNPLFESQSRSNRMWPISNPTIVSCYGSRDLSGKTDWHDGIDIRANIGTKIKAVSDGNIFKICNAENYNTKENPDNPKPCSGYGIYIIIKHPDNTYSRYNHLSITSVKEGQDVKKGEIIALSGNTGYSEGPHLDFKVYYSGDFTADVEKPSYRRDPLNYLPKLSDYTVANSAVSCTDSPTLLVLKNSGLGVTNTA